MRAIEPRWPAISHHGLAFVEACSTLTGSAQNSHSWLVAQPPTYTATPVLRAGLTEQPDFVTLPGRYQITSRFDDDMGVVESSQQVYRSLTRTLFSLSRH